MAVFLEIAALLFVFDDDEFGITADLSKGAGNFGSRDIRGADVSRVAAIVYQKHFIENYWAAFLQIPFYGLDFYSVAGCHFVLLAASFNDGKAAVGSGSFWSCRLRSLRGFWG